MTRWITLLLAGLMCLGLAACGGNAKYAKYDPIISALEAKEYEAAVEEIYRLYQADMKDPGSQSGSQDSEKEKDPYLAIWQERIPGEYIAYSYDEDETLENFTINEDGTCRINGKDLTWILEGTYDTNAQITVMDGINKAYRISLHLNGDGYIGANLSVFTDQNNTKSVNGIFFPLKYLTRIELTVDTWEQYFEKREFITVHENSFGEAVGMDVSQRMVLKEEYGKVLSNVSEVAVEYRDAVRNRYTVTADPEAKTYELGELLDTYESENLQTTQMGFYFSDDIGYYGMHWTGFNVSEFPTDEIGITEQKEITRMQGAIYCYEPMSAEQ